MGAADYVASRRDSGDFPASIAVDVHNYYNWAGTHNASFYHDTVCTASEDWWAYESHELPTFIGEWSIGVNNNANLNSFDDAEDLAFMRAFYAQQMSYFFTHPPTSDAI